MVAYLRKYRYSKFQRRRKAGDKAEETVVGVSGTWPVGLKPPQNTSAAVTLVFNSLAYEWQGYDKPLHPVSVEVDEKRRLHVFDRSGSSLRSFSLSSQSHLDVLLSNDRQCKVLLLKVPTEYDLVSRKKHVLFPYCLRSRPTKLFHFSFVFDFTQLLMQALFCRCT